MERRIRAIVPAAALVEQAAKLVVGRAGLEEGDAREEVVDDVVLHAQ
jgi:hypothetical protein